jgi:hypothetical protein
MDMFQFVMAIDLAFVGTAILFSFIQKSNKPRESE